MTRYAWHEMPYVGLDLETTGLDVANDRIVSAALWHVDPLVGAATMARWLVDPGIDIPPQASRIHGITTAQVRARGGVSVRALEDLAVTLRGRVDEQCPVIIYNAPYDLSLLHNELVRHRLGLLNVAPLRVIDPLVLDLKMDPQRPGSRRLSNVCAHYGVELREDQAHEAGADARAAAELALRIHERYPCLDEMSLEELHQAQVAWRAEQAAERQERLRRKGEIDAEVDGSWPLRRSALTAA